MKKETKTMKTIQIEKVVIDLATGATKNMVAEVSNEKTDKFHIYTLTYEGYRSDWQEVA